MLETAGRQQSLPNDFVIVCIGGELPAEFLGLGPTVMSLANFQSNNSPLSAEEQRILAQIKIVAEEAQGVRAGGNGGSCTLVSR